MKDISSPVIFIGSGRSGTTIMSEIIFRHESLAWPSNYQEKYPTVPEINLLRNVFENRLWYFQGQKRQLNRVSSINKLLFKPAEAYSFWEYLTGPRIDFSRGFLIGDRATPEESARIRTAFAKLVSYQLKQRLAFKITGPSRIGYLKSIFPEAVFIYIVREPLPTINSWLNVDFWQSKGKHQLWWRGAYTKSEEDWAKGHADKPELLAALQYRKLMDVTSMEIKEHNAHCLTVHYEDFVSNPASVIETIMDFAGLRKSEFVNDYLHRNKIFNQNENEKKMDSKRYGQYDGTQMDLILKGEYASAGN